MTSVLIVLIICATFGYIASASRQLWAFARDRGVPGWQLISLVSRQASALFMTNRVLPGRSKVCYSTVCDRSDGYLQRLSSTDQYWLFGSIQRHHFDSGRWPVHFLPGHYWVAHSKAPCRGDIVLWTMAPRSMGPPGQHHRLAVHPPGNGVQLLSTSNSGHSDDHELELCCLWWDRRVRPDLLCDPWTTPV